MKMNETYDVRFWNKADECIKIAGNYLNAFATFEDAWDSANAMLKHAYKKGAVCMSINNDFYDIIDD
ncbi:MAG: hypothetical protein IJW67_11190 [Blautia sp.]|nr:hypothetical protein [Blautia sp.]